jgi:hypothetical protein
VLWSTLRPCYLNGQHASPFDRRNIRKSMEI